MAQLAVLCYVWLRIAQLMKRGGGIGTDRESSRSKVQALHWCRPGPGGNASACSSLHSLQLAAALLQRACCALATMPQSPGVAADAVLLPDLVTQGKRDGLWSVLAQAGLQLGL